VWYNPKNYWPYLVDTRRTIDPDFEVTQTQRNKLCQIASNQDGANPINIRPYKKKMDIQIDEVFHKRANDIFQERVAATNRFFGCKARAKTSDKVSGSPLDRLRAIDKHYDVSHNEAREYVPKKAKMPRSQSVSEIRFETDKKPTSYGEIHMRRRQGLTPNNEADGRTHSRSHVENELPEETRFNQHQKKQERPVKPAPRPAILSENNIRPHKIIRPSSASQHGNHTPKSRPEISGYQNLVKQYTERSKAEESIDIKEPRTAKPYEPRSTYADTFDAAWSHRLTTRRNTTNLNARVTDSVRAPPSIPWHIVPSSNMQFLSRVDNLGGGRKLFHKQVPPSTLGVRSSHLGQPVLAA
jgi:hypothetical protein